MSTSPIVEELVADARPFLDGPVDDLVALLEGLAVLGAVEAPTPGPELALLLAGRPAATREVVAERPAPHAHKVHKARRVVAGFAAAAVAGLSITGAAAVANELPPSMQRAVARFSETYLPFSFPRPAGDPARSRGSSQDRAAPQRSMSPATLRPGQPDADERPPARGRGRHGEARPAADATKVDAAGAVSGPSDPAMQAPRPRPEDGVAQQPPGPPGAPAPTDGGSVEPGHGRQPGEGPGTGEGPRSGTGRPASPPGHSDDLASPEGPSGGSGSTGSGSPDKGASGTSARGSSGSSGTGAGAPE